MKSNPADPSSRLTLYRALVGLSQRKECIVEYWTIDLGRMINIWMRGNSISSHGICRCRWIKVFGWFDNNSSVWFEKHSNYNLATHISDERRKEVIFFILPLIWCALTALDSLCQQNIATFGSFPWKGWSKGSTVQCRRLIKTNRIHGWEVNVRAGCSWFNAAAC